MRRLHLSLIAVGLVVVSSLSTGLFLESIHRRNVDRLKDVNKRLILELVEYENETHALEDFIDLLMETASDQAILVSELQRSFRNFESDNISQNPDWLELNEHFRKVDSSNKALTLLWLENGAVFPPKHLELRVGPRKSVFRIGEQVNFDLESIIPLNHSTFTIWNPHGTIVWETDPLNTWQHNDTIWRVTYNDQTCNQKEMWLYENATLGQYTWMYLHNKQAYAQGEFTVRPPI